MATGSLLLCGWAPVLLTRRRRRLSTLSAPVVSLRFDRLARHGVLHAPRGILACLAGVFRCITRRFSNVFGAFARCFSSFPCRLAAFFGGIAGSLACLFRLLSCLLRILFGGILRPSRSRCTYSAQRHH